MIGITHQTAKAVATMSLATSQHLLRRTLIRTFVMSTPWSMMASAVGVVAIAASAGAATIAIDSNYTVIPTTNSSNQALHVFGTHPGSPAVTQRPLQVQMDLPTAGLPAGKYDVSFDLLFSDIPDQLEAAFRGTNSEANDFDGPHPAPTTSATGAKTIGTFDLDTWYHLTTTATVTTTAPDVYTGKFEFKPALNGGLTGNPADAYSFLLDNISVTDANGVEVLTKTFTFESDTVGQQASGIGGQAGSETVPRPLVVAVPEPATAISAGALFLCGLAGRRRRSVRL
jgi:hypothetical protein